MTPSFSPACFNEKFTHVRRCNKHINEVYSETSAKAFAGILSEKEQSYITPEQSQYQEIPPLGMYLVVVTYHRS